MSERSSAVEALDEFFRVVRRYADQDEKFAAELVNALGVPISIELEPKDLAKGLPYLDPVIIAGQGIDKFREVFRPLTDAQLRKIVVHFNIASKDAVPAKNGPKGEDLFDMLWKGANQRRQKLRL